MKASYTPSQRSHHIFSGKTYAKNLGPRKSVIWTTLSHFRSGCLGSQRTKLPLRRDLLHIPLEITGQVNMFSLEGREMLQILFFDLHALVLEGFYRLSQVHSVPEDNGCHHPRDAQRAVPSAEVASQARSILSLCSDKGSEIAL